MMPCFQRSESPEPSTSSYLSSLESSRPDSQLSDYYLGEYLPPNFPSYSSPQQQQQHPGNAARGAGVGTVGGTSCPTTPLFARRSVSPLCIVPAGWASSASAASLTMTRRRNSYSTNSSRHIEILSQRFFFLNIK